MTFAAAIALYSLTGAGFVIYLFRKPPLLLRALKILFIATVSFHLLTFLSRWIEAGLLPASTPLEALNLLVLLSSLAIAPFVLRDATAVLGAFFLPGAAMALAFAAPSFGGARRALAEGHRMWYTLHTLSVITGEAFLVIAAVASGAYLIHDRIIRRGDLHLSISRLPPLTVLDALLTGSLAVGFMSVSAGMVLGGLWASAVGVPFLAIAPKVTAGVILWSVFGLSLHQRLAIGWKGRRTALLVLFGAVLMIALFVLVNIFFPWSHGIRLI